MEKLKTLDLFAGLEVKPITGFPNYFISNEGRVFSYRSSSGYKEMYPYPGVYKRIELWVNGKASKKTIHSLVAREFCEGYSEGKVVNHVDGNKHNNHYLNLEWCTRSENQLHAYKLGLQKGFCVSGRKLSESHIKALGGSRWKSKNHFYYIEDCEYHTLLEAANFFKLTKQTILNRVNSKKFPTWERRLYDSK